MEFELGEIVRSCPSGRGKVVDDVDVGGGDWDGRDKPACLDLEDGN